MRASPESFFSRFLRCKAHTAVVDLSIHLGPGGLAGGFLGTAALNRRAILRRGHRTLSQSSPEPVRRNTKMSCREGLELIKPLPLREQRQCYERRGAIETNQERLLERSVYLVLMPGLTFFRPFLISALAGWIPGPLFSAFCVPHPTDYPSPPQPTQATWVGKGTNKSSFLHVNVPVY